MSIVQWRHHMDKREFYIEALRRKLYKDAMWTYATFAVTEDSVEYGAFYPTRKEDGYYFKDDNGNEIKIDDATDIAKPLINWRDELIVNIGDLENITADDTVTTYGRFFVNAASIVYAFGKKIPFVNKNFTPGYIEGILVKNFADEPQFGETYKEDMFYPSERVKFNDAVQHIARYNTIFVPGVSERTILPPPGIQEFRAQLMEKNKGRLDDPVVIAQMEKELIAFDAKYLEGDRSSEGFLIGGKDKRIVRKRLFLTFGGLSGFNENGRVDYVPQALVEGIQLDHMPEYNNDTRQGSYGRGVGTQLGGADVKRTLRATNNLEIIEDDCGVTHGIKYTVSDKDQAKFENLYYIVKGSPVLFGPGDAEKLNGKTVEFRIPGYCKTEGTGFCKKCCGELLSIHPHGLSDVAASVGNVIMGISMSAMHGKESKTEVYDIMSLIS